MSPVRPPGSGPARAEAPLTPAPPQPSAREAGPDPAPLPPAGPVTPRGRVKVQATKMGYYDHIRRRPGDVFWIHAPEDFSTLWMQAVDVTLPERITLGTAAIREDHDRLLTQKATEAALRSSPHVRQPPTGDASPLGDED